MKFEFKDKYDTFISINNYIYNKLVVRPFEKASYYTIPSLKIQCKKIEKSSQNIFLKLME